MVRRGRAECDLKKVHGYDMDSTNPMSIPSYLERCRVYRAILQRFLRRLEAEPPKIHVPRRAGLRRQHSGMIFHLHPELFLQDGGTTDFTCPGGRFPLRAGEIAIIPRGVPHGEIGRERRGSRFRTLVCSLHGGDITLIAGTTAPTHAEPLVEFCDSFEGPEISQAQRYVEDAAAVSAKTSATGEARRRALLFAALSVMDDLLSPARLARRTLSHEHPKVRHCHDLIQALLSEPRLSVTMLARQLGCTPDHLSRCFRAETSLTVSAYIREQRLGRAKALLQDPKLNISEIAWACGFGSLNYFVRSFRQAMGQPPGRYQQSLAPSEGAHSPPSMSK